MSDLYSVLANNSGAALIAAIALYYFNKQSQSYTDSIRQSTDQFTKALSKASKDNIDSQVKLGNRLHELENTIKEHSDLFQKLYSELVKKTNIIKNYAKTTKIEITNPPIEPV